MQNKNESGFIKMILVIVIVLALLKYLFNFDIIDFLTSPKIAPTIDYIKHLFSVLWNNYFKGLWDFASSNGKNLFEIGWNNLLLLLDKIKAILEVIVPGGNPPSSTL